MFSQTTEYALRAVVCLASTPDKPLVTPLIAETTKVPPGYLSKVLQALGRAGIVQSQRGLHGGFTLSKPPHELSVLDVVNAVDPIQRIKTCPLNLDAHGVKLCPLHRSLDDALAHVEETFRNHTIQDLIEQPTTSTPLGIARKCPGPVVGAGTDA
jgi:Rrf2 family protein